MAKPLNLESRFNDTEYNMQLRNMIVEINKLYDDVEHGRITQETANKTMVSLIDDPRYSQVKLKKQIDERDQEILLRDKSKFNDAEYNKQLQDMIVEITKLKDDVEHGRITQEAANETVISLIDSPRYNQVKLKKEIVEREYEFSLRNRSPRIPDEILNGTGSLSKNILTPVNLLRINYTYPLSYMTTNKGGLGLAIMKLQYMKQLHLTPTNM
jgi:polyhydroxyalkanoate synthesis regulator phasin